LEERLDQLEQMEPDSAISPPSSPVFAREDTSITTSSQAQQRTDGLQKRRRSSAHHFASEQSEVARVAAALESGRSLDAYQMQAFKQIIKSEVDSLNEDLKGKATSDAHVYPHNLTLSNFADWTCLPTLVYELEYPRQEKINWLYVAEKTAATFGCIGVMMVVSQAYLYPPMVETVRMKEAGITLEQRMQELPWILSDMLFPLLLEQLLTWYVIWVSLTTHDLPVQLFNAD
jgi:sterol O-acyltransferase